MYLSVSFTVSSGYSLKPRTHWHQSQKYIQQCGTHIHIGDKFRFNEVN